MRNFFFFFDKQKNEKLVDYYYNAFIYPLPILRL